MEAGKGKRRRKALGEGEGFLCWSLGGRTAQRADQLGLAVCICPRGEARWVGGEMCREATQSSGA